MSKKEHFGVYNGKPVFLVTLDSGTGMQIEVSSFGASLRRIPVPDKNGMHTDVCLGYETLDDYIKDDVYLGAVLGRCANRIAGPHVTIGGTQWPLALNEGTKQLHGGPDGFNRRVWDIVSHDNASVCLSLDSPHLDQGYPGNLHVQVEYSLLPGGRLEITYQAESDRDTIVNLSNHTYFNLSGHASGPVSDHMLTVWASSYTPFDKDNLPTGEILPVAGTPLDFSEAAAVGARVSDPILASSRGYDHNYMIDGGGMRRAARLYSPRTGICLTVETTMPGMQVYSSGFLTERQGKGGARYAPFHGLCFETQYYPDAIHHPGFPSPFLPANTLYKQQTAFVFSASDKGAF